MPLKFKADVGGETKSQSSVNEKKDIKNYNTHIHLLFDQWRFLPICLNGIKHRQIDKSHKSTLTGFNILS